MHDGITIARRGIPAGVICTRPFIPTGRAMARALGDSEYAFAVIDLPIGSLTRAELAERAADAVRQLVSLLHVEAAATIA